MELTNKAKAYATKWHGLQMYGDETYVDGHLAKVAALVEAMGGDHQTIATAWLHDILEDTHCPQEDILEGFGQKIYDAVIALTKSENDDYHWYLHRLKENKIARLVKYADASVNYAKSVSAMDEDTWRRILKYGDVIRQLWTLL
jgi:(p)ppGpp synthase/HD superfamily hydrolase